MPISVLLAIVNKASGDSKVNLDALNTMKQKDNKEIRISPYGKPNAANHYSSMKYNWDSRYQEDQTAD